VSSAGIPTNGQSFFGCGVRYNAPLTSGALYGFDPRITVGSGWDYAGRYTMGGACAHGTGVYGQLSFTPTVPVDTFKIWYQRVSGGGTFSAKIGAGTATNVNSNGAEGMLSQVITGTLGVNTLNINYVSAGDVHIKGIEAYDSASKRVHFINCGWGTSSTTDWFTSCRTDITTFAPDLTIINLGINDEMAENTAPGSLPLATSQSNLQAIINAVTTGSILIVTHTPYNNAVTDAEKNTYVTMVKNLAAANNIPVLDYYLRSGGFINFNNAGLIAADNIHPNQNGYADMALAIKNRILV